MKRFLLLPILIAMLSSCVLHSPFAGREHYFQAMGKEGSLVITIDKSRADVPFVSDPVILSIADKAERISLEIIPSDEEAYPLDLSGCIVNGGAEGDYSYAYINSTLLHNAPGFEKRGKHYHSDDLEAGVAAPGLLLFSTSSYEELFQETFSERVARIPDDVADAMASAPIAVFSLSPKTLPSIGIDIPVTVVRKIDTLLLLIDGDSLTGYLDMDTETSAKTLVTLLRNELIKAARAEGRKPDIQAMLRYFVQDGDKVMLDYALSGLLGSDDAAV